MKCGIDSLQGGAADRLLTRLRAEPFAVLTHAAAADHRGVPLLRLLSDLKLAPQVVFAPEHGLSGLAQAEESVASERSDQRASTISLYGSDKASLSPTDDDLAGLGTLVIDLVDVGSRYYTYAWTALLVARAAAKQGVHCVVLDRPNPISGDAQRCEGRAQQSDFLSFVGLEPVPVRHGLTLGELLALHLSRDGQELGPEGALSTVGVAGWERNRLADAWGRPFVPPSPNMPTLETALLYPGGCLLEGTNLSEGRGTAFPFRAVGAPFLDGDSLTTALNDSKQPGVLVRPFSFRPSFEKHAGEICHGVMLHVTDPSTFRPVQTYLELIRCARLQCPTDFEFLDRAYEFETDRCAFDLLTGSAVAREMIQAGASGPELTHAICPVAPEWREVHKEAEQLARAASHG